MDIEQTLAEYKALKLELEPKLQEVKELEIALKKQLLVIEHSLPIELSGVKCTLRKGYTRSSWDNKSLRGYAAAHPEIKESEVNSTVVLKIL